mgnify:CR=1 FL=1
MRLLMDIDRSRLPDPAEVRRCLFMRALEEAESWRVSGFHDDNERGWLIFNVHSVTGKGEEE